MVEGPLVHRVAEIHRLLFLAKAFVATSPNGRFTEGADAIDGLYVSLIKAHGKNIFYFFTRQKLENAVLENLPEDVVVVHIHFGMSGNFRTFIYPGPPPREKTRLRLYSERERLEAHLSATVCIHGNMDLYREKIAKLGPDPLHEDADKDAVWRKIQKSKKTIGGILMDQTLIAGIGNIYRTGMAHDRAGNRWPPFVLIRIEQSIQLFRIGLITGSIITVSPEHAGKPYAMLEPGEKCYVYSHKVCKLCQGIIRSWTSASRTIYACEVCQPLRGISDNTAMRYHDLDKSEVTGSPSGLTMSSKDSDSDTRSNVKETKMVSTITVRKKMKDGQIMEHQALKGISWGTMVDVPSKLIDLTWPRPTTRDLGSDSSGKGHGKTAQAFRQQPSVGTQNGHLIVHRDPRTSWVYKATGLNHFLSRKTVGCIEMKIRGHLNSRAAFGLQAFRIFGLGSRLLVLK